MNNESRVLLGDWLAGLLLIIIIGLLCLPG